MKSKWLLIVGNIKKHPLAWALAGVLALFLATRLYNLLAVPIFNDEAIYLHWAGLIRDDWHSWHNVFISLSDGKQPSFIWAESITLNLFSDPLLAGRLVSVAAGLGSLIGIYLLSRELFASKKIAIIAGLIYIAYPFSLVYDRMALYDSMLAMFAIWALYLEVLLIRRRQIGIALAAAVAIGGGMLTKSGALFFLVLLPFSSLLFDFSKKQKHKKKELLKWALLAVVVVVGAFVIQSIMRISPDFAVIDAKNQEFTLTIAQWLQSPIGYFLNNLPELVGFMVDYSTIPFLLLAVTAFFIDKKQLKEKLLLVSWMALPFLAFVCLAKVLYPRYILFMMMPLIPLAAYAANALIGKVKIRAAGVALMLVLFLPMVVADYLIVANFAAAPIPIKDRSAFIEGQFSGVGVNEAVQFIKEQSKNQKIYVGMQGGFGLMPFALESYLRGNQNVEIQAFGGTGYEPPSQVTDAAKKMPAYFIFRAGECSTCPAVGLPPGGWPVEKVFSIKRIEPNSYFTMVRVVPQQ